MLTIAFFEFKARMRLVSTWIYFLVFFALALVFNAAAGGMFKSANVVFGSGKVFLNGPYALLNSLSVLAMLGTTIVAAVLGRAVQQDFEYRTHTFFFTSPITKTQYLGGRFLGAFAATVVIFLSVGLGTWLATYLPGMDPSRIGPNHFAAYLVPYLFVIIPNIFFVGALFFSLAATTRRMLPVYIGSVLLLIGWLISLNLLNDMENKSLAALVDPFGAQACTVLTQYWSLNEQNTRPVLLTGVLLWNRLLWVGGAALVLALAGWRFSFAQFAAESRGRRSKTSDDVPAALPSRSNIKIKVDVKTPRWSVVFSLATLYLNNVVRDLYFGVLVFAGLLFLIFSSTTLGDIYGTSTWPVTAEMMTLVNGRFFLFMLAIITFYSGELVWREREVNFSQITDATPVPTWIPFIGKLLALMTIPVLLQFVVMLGGIGIQLARGYTHLQPALWIYDLFGIQLINYWFLCALALTIHSLVNQKYLGHFLMIVYFITGVFSGPLGFEDLLYKFGRVPQPVYSDLNGFGEMLFRTRMFQWYWSAASALMLVAAYVFWVRGTVSGWRDRMAIARQRLTVTTVAIAALSAVAFASFGGFIFYNTHVVNPYRTTYDDELDQANYEKTWKPTASLPQPKITAVAVNVDLFPKVQRVRMRGTYTIQNKNSVPVDTVEIGFASREAVQVNALSFSTPATLAKEDKRLGVRLYHLTSPLAPNDKATLTFDLELAAHGFKNGDAFTDVVENGTFINGLAVLPVIGYQDAGELARDQDRRKFDLAPKERMRDREDPQGLSVNYVSRDADWIDFQARVTTDADQIAIAPGYLTSDTVTGDRRTFEYRMDVPILNFFAFQSARYAVKRDVWHDAAGQRDVPLEIYYQPGHEFNLDTMIASSKAALTYYTANFGPYQHRQLRIIEFPRYATFAQSFPNTVPFSEAIGFIARIRPDDVKDIDYPYYVTAHEVAHQWWAHQVIGGNVQGATALSETLAQYSALMVMKQKFGAAKMRRFLSYELDRYLIGRASEQKKELPLGRVENQDYIHYRKGSLVMYTLQDYIGEDKVNEALHAFVAEQGLKGPPYPNARMLVDAFRKVTPPDLQYLLDDMFERIVVYDNRALTAAAKKQADGSYLVTLEVKVSKLISDGVGKETSEKPNDLIEIGVLDASGTPLFLEKRRITQDQSTFTISVKGVPAKAGVDPYNELIDRTPSDNVIPVAIS